MTKYGNVMSGTYTRISHGDEIFLKYFSWETGNTDHFIDTVIQKGY